MAYLDDLIGDTFPDLGTGGFNEPGFQDWYSGMAGRTGLNPDPDDPRHYYDYRAAYSAGAEPMIADDGLYHWPSEFKTDDHPNRYVDGMDTKTGAPVSGVDNNYESSYIDELIGVTLWPSAPTPPASALPTGPAGALSTGNGAKGPPIFGRTFSGTAGDIGVSAARGIVALGESLVGLSDIPTLGYAGKLAKKYLGYDPKLTQEALDSLYSDAQKAANERVQNAKGFVDTAVEMIKNPSTIADSAIQSFPMMLGGAGAARALISGGVKIPPMVASALFEGVLSSGSSAEQIRQQTEDGLLTMKQALSSVAAGAGTSAFALAGGRVAEKLGIADVDTMLAGGGGNVTKAGVIKRIIGGGISEGVFEELPQSVQEQIWQNAAMDRPLMEGALEAGATGMLTGAAMGAGSNIISSGETETGADKKTDTGKGGLVDETLPPAPTPEEIKASFKSGEYTAEDLENVKFFWGDDKGVAETVDELLGVKPETKTASKTGPAPESKAEPKPEETPAAAVEPSLFEPQTPEEQAAIQAEIEAQRAPGYKVDTVAPVTDRVARLAADNQAEIDAVKAFDKKVEDQERLESIAETSKQREARRTKELQGYLRSYFDTQPSVYEERVRAERIAADQAKEAGLVEPQKPTPITKMEEDAQFKSWQIAAENRGYTPAEIKEAYDFVQKEAEEKAMREWEVKGRQAAAYSTKESKADGKAIAAEFNKSNPGYDLKYDGIQEGADATQAMHQFTPQSGPIEGATFYSESLSPENVKAALNRTLKTWGKEPLATTSLPSQSSITLDDLKSLKLTRRGSVVQNKDGSFSVSFPNNRGFHVEAVDSTGDAISFKTAYGRKLKPGEEISGSYEHDTKTIKIVKGVGDKWTITHEFQHFLERSGMLTKDEIDALERQSAVFNKGKYRGEEGRARWVAHELEARAIARTSTIGKIIQKIQDIIDSFVSLGEMTGRKAIRAIESGEVVTRKAKGKNAGSLKAVDPVANNTSTFEAADKLLSDMSAAPSKQEVIKLKDLVEKQEIFKPGASQSLQTRKAKLKFDTGGTAAVLLKTLIKQDPSTTMIYEMMQNSLDAHTFKTGNSIVAEFNRAAEIDESTGKRVFGSGNASAFADGTKVDMSDASGILTFADNGKGMSIDQLEKFMLVGGSEGKSGKTERGGYGLAKIPILLVPNQIRISTTKNGKTAIVNATREDILLNDGGELYMTEYDTPDRENGTTIEAVMPKKIANQSVNSSTLLSAAEKSFDGTWANATMTYISDGETRLVREPTLLSDDVAVPKKLPVRRFTLRGNTVAIYTLKVDKYGLEWFGGGYTPDHKVTNKGLVLNVSANIRSPNIPVQPNFKYVVDFEETVGTKDLNYPFLNNRTEMDNAFAEKIRAIIGENTRYIMEDFSSLKVEDFKNMLKNSPVYDGIRVLIPYQGKEFKEAMDIVNANEDVIKAFARLTKIFTDILVSVGETGVNFHITIDPEVHGYKSKKEVVGEELYAINPFSVTAEFMENTHFQKAVNAGRPVAELQGEMMAAVTLPHEYSHMRVSGHQESFVNEFHRVQVAVGSKNILQLTNKMRYFYEKYGDRLDEITRAFSNLQGSRSGLENSFDNLPTGKIFGGGKEVLPGLEKAGKGIPSFATQDDLITAKRFVRVKATDASGIKVDALLGDVSESGGFLSGYEVNKEGVRIKPKGKADIRKRIIANGTISSIQEMRMSRKYGTLEVYDAKQEQDLKDAGTIMFSTRQELTPSQRAFLEKHIAMQAKTFNQNVTNNSKSVSDLNRIDEAKAVLLDKHRDFMRWFVDKNHPIKMVQGKLSALSEAIDLYMKESNRPKVTSAKLKDAWDNDITPLLKRMANLKISTPDLEEFAHALHAPEANAHLRVANSKHVFEDIVDKLPKAEQEKIAVETAGIKHPDEYKKALDVLTDRYANNQNVKKLIDYWVDARDRLSGMTDARAKEVLKFYAGDKKIRRAAALLWAINRKTLDIRYESGSIPRETYDTLKAKYQYYVPLYREGYENEPIGGSGQGLSILGRPMKTRMGSTSNVVNILANSVSNLERAINVAEKTESAKVLLGLIKANPNQAVWKIKAEKKTPHYDNYGNLRLYPDRFSVTVNQMRIMVDGKQYLIEINQANKDAMRMLRTLKAEDAQHGLLISAFSKINRYLSMVNTAWSPEFIITNLPRDFQTAAINIGDTGIKSKSMLKGTLESIKAIYAVERGRRKGLPLEGVYDRFRAAGGKIGWADAHSNIKSLSDDINRDLKVYSGKAPVRKTVLSWMKLIEDANTSVENGVRLHVFNLATKAGMSDAKAASIASDITVDFTKKGAAGPAINALFLFANAGIQGTYRIFRALMSGSPRVWTMVGGIATAGFLTGLMNVAVGGEDDDDQDYFNKLIDNQAFLLERNAVFMIPGSDGKHVKIPLPWGYNFIWNIGTEASRVFTKEHYDPLSGAARMASVFANAFNPIASGTLAQMLTPTLFDPIAQVAENKNWFGGDLMPGRNVFEKTPTPDSQRYWKSVRPLSKWMTEQLNELTGGSVVRPGKIDVSPETIDLLVDTAGGSALRVLQDSVNTPYKAIKKEQVAVHEIPFMRRFFGEVSEGVDAKIYYNNSTQVFTAEAELKAYMGSRHYDIMRDKLKPMIKMIGITKSTDGILGKLRKERNTYEAIGNKDVVDKVNDRILQIQKAYNKKFNEVNNPKQ